MQILVRQSARVKRSRGRRMTIGFENADQPVHDPAHAADSKLDVIEMLQKLSPEHREVIDLVYYHEKTVQEVAEIVGIPEATVKTRMFYARKRLSELLKTAGIDRGWP